MSKNPCDNCIEELLQIDKHCASSTIRMAIGPTFFFKGLVQARDKIVGVAVGQVRARKHVSEDGEGVQKVAEGERDEAIPLMRKLRVPNDLPSGGLLRNSGRRSRPKFTPKSSLSVGYFSPKPSQKKGRGKKNDKSPSSPAADISIFQHVCAGAPREPQ